MEKHIETLNEWAWQVEAWVEQGIHWAGTQDWTFVYWIVAACVLSLLTIQAEGAQ